ncbi:hypothetical protein X740_13650 [Mesorhizobium sp. LNHC221B00]|nr:hypothetical protein [Mesorhizobium sp. LNHC221B00]ESY80390.1 hypothetical protein X740_13650 [Mesorhizobium sp. LNHC221B00]
MFQGDRPLRTQHVVARASGMERDSLQALPASPAQIASTISECHKSSVQP